jgi:hypothetical protein
MSLLLLNSDFKIRWVSACVTLCALFRHIVAQKGCHSPGLGVTQKPLRHCGVAPLVTQSAALVQAENKIALGKNHAVRHCMWHKRFSQPCEAKTILALWHFATVPLMTQSALLIQAENKI